MDGGPGTADRSGPEPEQAPAPHALEQLQSRLGLTPTGTLPLGQAVFLPSAIRITMVSGALGNPAAGQVLTGTSTGRIVTISLNVAQQTEVKAGDKVTITLPDGLGTPGVISSVGTVATGSASSAAIPVTVTLTDPAAIGSLDQAPVQVQITAASVSDALVVPADALLAQASGGYAVEEVTPGGRRHLVPVSLGLSDDADGLVQVTGPGWRPGSASWCRRYDRRARDARRAGHGAAGGHQGLSWLPAGDGAGRSQLRGGSG
jgi:hypothetical protein